MRTERKDVQQQLTEKKAQNFRKKRLIGNVIHGNCQLTRRTSDRQHGVSDTNGIRAVKREGKSGANKGGDTFTGQS